MLRRITILRCGLVRWSLGLVLIGGTLDPTNASAAFTNLNLALPGLMISSVAWGDYNNDGWLDLVLTGSVGGTPHSAGLSQIWRNMGNGTFSNLTTQLPQIGASSASWDDFDNDGKLDLLLTGYTTNGNVAQAWRNAGNGVFADINAGLPGVELSAAAWGDYDNDGRSDILLTGLSATGRISTIYKNLGNGLFSETSPGLPAISSGSVDWGDYDNDGWLDIYLSGCTGVAMTNQVWRNLANGAFSNLNLALPPIGDCGPRMFPTSGVWGDSDNDGWLDILFAGNGAFGANLSDLWQNLANGTFVKVNSGLVGKVGDALAWGDFDNDGRLDVACPGASQPSAGRPQVMRNTGNNIFTNGASGIEPTAFGSVAWGDFDSDTRLDLVLTGQLGNNSLVSQVWRNHSEGSNTVPSAPAGLTADLQGNRVVFSWSAASDLETPVDGLTYNLRVGRTPGGTDVKSPLAEATGRRLVPRMGNAQHRLFSLLTSAPAGRYYWTVQAIDTSFAGGPFAVEKSFVLGASILNDANFGLSNGVFGFNVMWQTGEVVVVSSSTNLIDWDRIWTNSSAQAFAYFSDPDTSAQATRFYRALLD